MGLAAPPRADVQLGLAGSAWTPIDLRARRPHRGYSDGLSSEAVLNAFDAADAKWIGPRRVRPRAPESLHNRCMVVDRGQRVPTMINMVPAVSTTMDMIIDMIMMRITTSTMVRMAVVV
jgi:hypothetical protein